MGTTTTETERGQANAIYRCHECRRTVTIVADWTEVHTITVNGISGERIDWGGQGKHYILRQRAICPTCGRKLTKRGIVQGEETDHECDARCQTSESAICRCGCGGKNHGAAYLIYA